MTKKEESGMVRLRFRVLTVLAGKTYPANSIETVEATDEAWQAVNKGQADLEPAPGMGGQPFPPDWMQQAEGAPEGLAPTTGKPGAVEPEVKPPPAAKTKGPTATHHTMPHAGDEPHDKK